MHTLVPLKKFDEVATEEADNVLWVQAWKYSSWEHPEYGTVEITPEKGQEFKRHFDAGTYGQELLANYEHGEDKAKGSKSAGKVLDIDVRDDGVYYKTEFTQTALDEIKKGEWKYISPEFNDWTDREKGVTHENVPMGLALTNRPFFKGMAPLNFSEYFTTVDDTKRAQEFAEWTIEQKNKAFAEWESKKDEEDSMNETLRKFAEALGITFADTDTEETILAKAVELNEIIEPLRKAKEEGSKLKTFREAFPQEYEELQLGRSARIEGDARRFAEKYERFSTTKTITKDDGSTEEVTETSNHGFSGVALKAIEEAHKAFAEGSPSVDKLDALMTVLSSESAVVEFTEKGSTREGEIRVPKPGQSPRMQFAELVTEIQAKDNLEYEAALKLAMDREPEMADAYMNDRREVK